MKKIIFVLVFMGAALLAASGTMTVFRSSGDTIYMRSAWNGTQDLFRVCGLGGNKQFN